MPGMIVLEDIELVPVLLLEPFKFATENRSRPSGRCGDLPEDWHRYWSDCLGDSGLTGLNPLQRGSWHVPTTEFADPDILRRLLALIFNDWGGVDVLSDPECTPVLNGGLALYSPTHGLLAEPRCCADLSDTANWRAAATCTQPEWQMLWIGHPWLSVKCQTPWLMIGDKLETTPTEERWAISPDELVRAVATAESELGRFSGQIAMILTSLGYGGDTERMGRKLTGLEQ